MKQIRHTDTLVYYDDVQVFSGRDVAGGRYIGVLADSSNSSDIYVVVRVSAKRMERFCTGAPDLKALLVEEARDGWYLAEVRDGFAGPLTLQEQSGADVETNLTPEDDFVLGVLSYMVVQQRGPYLPTCETADYAEDRRQFAWTLCGPVGESGFSAMN